jgi:spore coat polysaccharide biosynthesis protein SpsF
MNPKKSGAIIQARMGSTRLPGKVLKKIGNRSILRIIVDRLKESETIDEIIIVTTEKKEDDPIIEFCRENNIKYYRGPEQDVLRRYIEAAEKYDIEQIVRVTGDNPLTSPKVIDVLLKSHQKKNSDYTFATGLPLGVSAEVVERKILENLDSSNLDDDYKEHVTFFIRENEKEFKINSVDFQLDDNIRVTVDTKEDLKLIKEIDKEIGPIEKLSVEEVIAFLNNNTKIKKINANVLQKSPKKDLKRISVILRTYNSQKYLEKALESCLNQTLSKDYFEVILIDDGSEDDTRSLLNLYKLKYPDFFKLILKEHEGPIKSLNRGIKESKDLTIVLDSDDWFEIDILEKMLDVHEKNDIEYVYSNYYEIGFDSDNKRECIVVDKNFFNLLIGGIMFKKETIARLTFFDESLFFPEYDFFIKLRKNNVKGYYLNEPLYNYNRREGSITSNPNLVKKGKKELEEKWNEKIEIRDY